MNIRHGVKTQSEPLQLPENRIVNPCVSLGYDEVDSV